MQDTHEINQEERGIGTLHTTKAPVSTIWQADGGFDLSIKTITVIPISLYLEHIDLLEVEDVG